MKKKKKKQKLKRKLIVILLILFSVVVLFERNKHLLYRYFRPYEQESRSYEYYKSFFDNYSVFGLDVSLFQGDIDWEILTDNHDVDFVFIRATAGIDRLDDKFEYNWIEAKNNGILRGAYHYFRPNENSREQAMKFINNVVLKPGDLPPVLDIEEYSNVQSTDRLKTGLLNWLVIVEEHYGVTPIIYTYNRFYRNVFEGDVRFYRYPFWIAWYNTQRHPDEIMGNWHFWQFTDRGTITGIDGFVDINVFNGKKQDLLVLTKSKVSEL